jgi:hypothetical protein
LVALAAAVLAFFIPSLPYLLCFEHVHNLGNLHHAARHWPFQPIRLQQLFMTGVWGCSIIRRYNVAG